MRKQVFIHNMIIAIIKGDVINTVGWESDIENFMDYNSEQFSEKDVDRVNLYLENVKELREEGDVTSKKQLEMANYSKEEAEKIQDNAQAAYDLMDSKGMTFQEKQRVMNSFRKQGVYHNESSEVRYDGCYHKHRDVDGMLFSSPEEARLMKALIDAAPEGADKTKVSQVLTMTLTLLGVKSDWAFDVKGK